MQDNIREELNRYIAFGYSLEGAVRQVKAIKLNRLDAMIDAVANKLK